MMYKYFGAYINEEAKRGTDEAIAVRLYINKPTDAPNDAKRRIDRAEKNGDITADRAVALKAILKDCAAQHKRSGNIVDVRDPRDWRSLGDGARMRRTHKDSACL